MAITGIKESRTRVLIIGINYRPELTAVGPYTAALAEYLASRDNEVFVVTGIPHYPDWRIARGTPLSLVREESIDGVTVIRAAHYVPKSQTAMKRAMYEASFGLTGLLASLRLRRLDAILGVVPSLSGGILARLTAKRLHAPYGLLFQDLVSRAARQSGIAGGNWAARTAAAAEMWATREACAIGVVAEVFIPYLVSLGVDSHKIHHVPNWSRVSAPALSRAETRACFGWTDHKQVVLHAGNMGLKQNLMQILEAARLAAKRGEPAQFVFSGGGNQAGAIRAAARNLPNVSFTGVQPDGIHSSLLGAADVLLLSECTTQIDMSMPSKLTSYYAAGRPIIASVPLGGGSALEVERSGAGLVVPAGEPERLLDALARLRAEPGFAVKLGETGLAYARTNTSAAVCLPRAVALVDKIAARRAPVIADRSLGTEHLTPRRIEKPDSIGR